jgi:hypothetical protein
MPPKPAISPFAPIRPKTNITQKKTKKTNEEEIFLVAVVLVAGFIVLIVVRLVRKVKGVFFFFRVSARACTIWMTTSIYIGQRLLLLWSKRFFFPFFPYLFSLKEDNL